MPIFSLLIRQVSYFEMAAMFYSLYKTSGGRFLGTCLLDLLWTVMSVDMVLILFVNLLQLSDMVLVYKAFCACSKNICNIHAIHDSLSVVLCWMYFLVRGAMYMPYMTPKATDINGPAVSYFACNSFLLLQFSYVIFLSIVGSKLVTKNIPDLSHFGTTVTMT